ncbi:MAG: hypothetical protein ACK4SZ_15415 [Allosphingosinicella sp.]
MAVGKRGPDDLGNHIDRQAKPIFLLCCACEAPVESGILFRARGKAHQDAVDEKPAAAVADDVRVQAHPSGVAIQADAGVPFEAFCIVPVGYESAKTFGPACPLGRESPPELIGIPRLVWEAQQPHPGLVGEELPLARTPAPAADAGAAKGFLQDARV